MSDKRSIRRDRLMIGTAGFGNWISESVACEIVDAAVALGICRFDTATSYGRSEEILGLALTSQTEPVLVATKISPEIDLVPDISLHDQIFRLVERSLRHLRRDRIDLLQLHDPLPQHLIVPAFETFETLQKNGMIREIGLCNYSSHELLNLFAILPSSIQAAPITLQNQHNLLQSDLSPEIVPICLARGLSTWAWSPLAGGMLTGRYNSSSQVPAGSRAATGNWLPVEDISPYLPLLDKLSNRYDMGLAQFALDWVLNSNGINGTIIGPSQATQLNLIELLTADLSYERSATSIW